jgi:hypothetical protein
MAYGDPTTTVPTVDPIRALMDSLTGQQSQPSATPQPQTYGLMGPPSGAPQPDLSQQNAPPAPSLSPVPTETDENGVNRNILSRIGGLITGGASRIGNTLLPGPSGALAQYVSPDDVRHARATALLQAGLGMMAASGAPDATHPAGTTASILGRALSGMPGSYADALQRPIEQSQEALAIQQQAAKLQARAAIARQFAPQPGETIPQTAQRTSQLSAALAAAGLGDESKGVSAAGDVLARGLNTAAGHPVEHIDAGDRILAIDSVTGQQLASYPKGLAPEDPNAGKLTPSQAASQAAELRKEFYADNKPYYNQATAFQRYQQLRSDPNTSPADLNLAMQTIMSGSPTARAAMVQMIAKQTGSTVDKVESLFTKSTAGGLSPGMLQLMDRAAANSLRAGRTDFRSSRDTYGAIARSQSLDPTNLFREPTVVLPEDTAPPGSATRRGAPVDLSRNPFPAGQ